jgi:hypothetical protein
MDFFMVNKLGNGKFVDVGYIMTSSTAIPSYGPRTQKYIYPDVDKKLGDIIEHYAGTPWAEKLDEFRNSPKYKFALENGSYTPFILGDCNIIKLGRYKFNWRNQVKNAEYWEKNNNDVIELRRKYGFGKDEDSYSETDWRRKPVYGGVGLRKVLKSGTQGVSKYQPGMHDTLYTSKDGKMALRQQLARENNDRSVWFFVDEFGKMTEIPKDVIYFLMHSFSKIKNNKGTVDLQAMDEDERNFKAELAALDMKTHKATKTMLLDSVLYIAGTTTGKNGEKISIAYVNDQTIYQEYPFLKKSEINKIIAPWIKLADGELLDESFQPFGKSRKRLNESVLLTDLPKDAMQELNSILFTPRYAYTLEKFAESPKFGYLADFVAAHILDDENQTIYVIDPNVTVSGKTCSDIFACASDGLYMAFQEDNRFNDTVIDEDNELDVVAYQQVDRESLFAAVYDNESGVWFTNMYTFVNTFNEALGEGDYDL